jgi:hypothetical protein
MPTEVAQEISKKTKDHAKRIQQELKELTNDLGPRYWKTSERITEVHEAHLWQVLGYENETHFREELFISKGSWHEKIRLWREFAKPAMDKEALTRARLDRMPSQNAKQLLRIPDGRKFQAKWIEWALTLKEGQLEAKVDHILENNGDESTLGQAEARALLKISCTTSQKAFILDTMARFADVHDIDKDDHGKIVEDMAAEIASGLPTPEEAAAGKTQAAEAARVN